MKTEHNFYRSARIDRCCSTDNLRPAMRCILFKDGFAYATDSYVIIKVPVDRISNLEKEQIDRLNGKRLHMEAYKKIINFPSANINENGITCICDDYTATFGFYDGDAKFPNVDYVFSTIGKMEMVESISFNTRLIRKIESVFGSDANFTFEFHGNSSACIVRPYFDDYGEAMAILMPLVPK